MKPFVREYSAGGIVIRGRRVLLIRMRKLDGELVWTYPKGHLERGETPRQAARREVTEETGWTCDIVRTVAVVRYSFRRKDRPVRKRVRWYWMRPLRRVGRPDGTEIFGMRWLGFPDARKTLDYPSDKRLLSRMERLCAKSKPATNARTRRMPAFVAGLRVR